MRLRRCGASTLPMGLALALWGCDNEGAPPAGDRGLPGADASVGRAWVLSAEARFSLTVAPSDPAFPFVSPLEAVIQEDGSTLIRDGSTTLVYLNPDGSAARIAGSPGRGPGEFGSLRAILDAPGGSGVWAWDSRSRRLSHFDRSGEYVTSLVPPGRTRAPPVAILPGPRFVTLTAPEQGTGTDPARRRYALRDSQWTVVREIPGPPEPASPELTWTASGITNHHQLPAGCVPRPAEVVIGNELFAADAASGVVHAFGEDRFVREAYRASERQSFTAEIRTALEARLERRFAIPGREAPAHVRRDVLQDVRNRIADLGNQLPAWQRVLADPEGRLWLQRSVCPLGGGDDVFDVVTIEGQRLGSVTIPEGMTVLAVRGDDVLVRRIGELDIQHVEMYRLTAAEPPSEGS
jgi:hypothetical protein